MACAGRPLREVLALFLQLTDAVAFAHRHLLVHRDLKPGNVLVNRDGQVKLLDFGIAKALDPLEDPGAPEQTQAGQRPFTPSHASPEQIRGEPVSTATDVYSLGVLLYQLLTGRLPHQSESMARLMYEIANERVADVRSLRPGLPEAMAMVLALALEKRAELRYANGEDFAQDLEAVLAQVQESSTSVQPAPAADIDPFASTQRIELPPKP